MIIPITIKILNTRYGHKKLPRIEYTFNFDISLTIDILKRYIISYLNIATTTDKIEIINHLSAPMENNYTIKNTMKNKKFLDIEDNFENIFYLYFTCV